MAKLTAFITKTLLMNKICSLLQLSEIIKIAKSEGRTKVSNYFPNPTIHTRWINRGELSIHSGTNSDFLIHNRTNYREIIFFSKDYDTLKQDLDVLLENLEKPAVIEIISKGIAQKSIPINAVLKRMMRVGQPTPNPVSPKINVIRMEDIVEIMDIFKHNFHAALERVPDIEEIRDLIAKGSILVYRTDNEHIVGFIVYELIGSSIHLRYWWVDASMRNKGIGSALMNSFFYVGKETKRQYLWVFDDNENAIKRYKHYGFEFDGMQDQISLFE